MKLDKYIAYSGYCSRRKACDLLDEKRVKINGKIAKYTTEFKEGDLITIDDIQLKVAAFVSTLIAYHKPKGIVCTAEKTIGNIIEAIGHEQQIFPIGRLDKDSEGLILLTNEGKLIDKIANAANEHEKEYIVTLNLPVRKQFLNEIASGITIQKEKTKPCIVALEPNTKRVFRIILTQGLNRQIRRMCTAFNYQVIKLQRVRVMNIELKKLKPGEWRNLTEEEKKVLFEQLN